MYGVTGIEFSDLDDDGNKDLAVANSHGVKNVTLLVNTCTRCALEKPGDGEVVRNGLVFAWYPVKRADFFEIKIVDDEGQSVWSQVLPGRQNSVVYTWPALQKAAEYTWSVIGPGGERLGKRIPCPVILVQNQAPATIARYAKFEVLICLKKGISLEKKSIPFPKDTCWIEC